ncbi:MAG: TfoX/Sxy family protein [Actinomycetales bacterium]|uniref:TfoX/Sxy family protein n=1 Tax=Candidatus Phosphoribacter hodrii TaxID=2953743 RepID=A0A935MII6_9MICO|nr:TfoX/Sxy family protein [Candidatus Phosphoribacter hodrii]HOF37054.1 TfoX/Sxy family protein [Dermatophilaceae bacterium]
MAFDPELADRLREVLADEPGLREQRMFGGLGFMLDGHMAVAASSDGGILLRIDPAAAGDLVDGVVARRFEMRGRAMDGWLAVDPAAAQTDEALREWVAHGVAYVRSLPPK